MERLNIKQVTPEWLKISKHQPALHGFKFLEQNLNAQMEPQDGVPLHLTLHVHRVVSGRHLLRLVTLARRRRRVRLARVVAHRLLLLLRRRRGLLLLLLLLWWWLLLLLLWSTVRARSRLVEARLTIRLLQTSRCATATAVHALRRRRHRLSGRRTTDVRATCRHT